MSSAGTPSSSRSRAAKAMAFSYLLMVCAPVECEPHLPKTFARIEDIRELSPSQAARELPVHLRAVVTFYDQARACGARHGTRFDRSNGGRRFCAPDPNQLNSDRWPRHPPKGESHFARQPDIGGERQPVGGSKSNCACGSHRRRLSQSLCSNDIWESCKNSNRSFSERGPGSVGWRARSRPGRAGCHVQ